MKPTNRALLPAVLAAAALLCPLAFRQAEAQPAKSWPPISRVQVVVRDLSTQQDIGSVEPGGTISVPAGSQVRLILAAVPSGNRPPVYPAATFSDQSQGGLRFTRTRPENGTADVQVGNAKGNRGQAVGYQVQDDRVPANLRSGTIYIQVVPGAATPESVGSLSGSARAQELTRMLYRAILLRDPDPGAQGTVDSIERGGYDALVQAAVGIANSKESRFQIPQSTNNEERLSALYQNLLGLSADRVDRQQYESDLRRLNQGQIGDVVSGMVQSDRFRSRANVASVRY
ncbi:MAG TPA: hypothetical protein VF173_30270 [Thermoanaerobaculia bacterium]|nr:hypothetical protein [Thermoanaerobaculia bacterium]